MKEIELQHNIMRRVVRMYYLKKIINPVMLKLYALAAVAFGVTSLVSIKSVIANMPSLFDIGNLVYFAQYAFVHTELSVQIAISLAAIVAVLLVKDSVVRLSHSHELAA